MMMGFFEGGLFGPTENRLSLLSFFALLVLLLQCCVVGANSRRVSMQLELERLPPPGEMYQNPLVPSPNNSPDPGAYVAWEDGLYYVATTSEDDTQRFPIRVSSDLVNWNLTGYIFPPKSPGAPTWAVSDFWAPEIHVVNGTTLAVFAARNTAGMLSVGLAISPSGSPLGPWFDRGAPIVTNATEGNIDPTVVLDHSTEEYYLVWKVDGNANGLPTPILAQKLVQLSPGNFTLVGPITELIRETLPWEGALVEAPWAIYNETQDAYFLFYSANAFYNASYAVGVAKAPTLLGPYVKSPLPILHSNDDWQGPGHCSVVPVQGQSDSSDEGDGDGALVMFYHAYPSNAVGGNYPRLLLMDAVLWGSDGWPYIATNSPSTSREPVP